MRVSEWLRIDPVSFDTVRRENEIKINKDVYEILISKLNAHYPEYSKDVLGLKIKILFNGRLVEAKVPYSIQPVEFYKWWIENTNSVKLTTEEKIKLFDVVYVQRPNILKKEHKKLIHKH